MHWLRIERLIAAGDLLDVPAPPAPKRFSGDFADLPALSALPTFSSFFKQVKWGRLEPLGRGRDALGRLGHLGRSHQNVSSIEAWSTLSSSSFSQSAAGSGQACEPCRASNIRRSSGSGGNVTPRRNCRFHGMHPHFFNSLAITGVDLYLSSGTSLRADTQNPWLRSSPLVTAMRGFFSCAFGSTPLCAIISIN